MRKISLLIVNSLDKSPGKWYSKTRARPGFPDSFYINKGEKTMKRSEVNKALRELEAMCQKYRCYLPPFCHFTPEEWERSRIR